MPRPPRIDLPHIAQRVVQRGNNRLPCFHAEIDYIRDLQDLREVSQREGCAVHAYVSMTNHVHLLLTPREPGQVSRVMQALGRRYVRDNNDRYHRTGTLWESPLQGVPGRRIDTCCTATATSNSTRYAHGWWAIRRTTDGRATAIWRMAARIP